MTTQNNFDRVRSDVNGNPRHVCHYLHLVNDGDRKEAKAIEQASGGKIWAINLHYGMALRKAARLGGRKFHNKQYGRLLLVSLR